jgi:Uncharacterised protein family (UPF0193)
MANIRSTSVKQGGAFNMQAASTYSSETKELMKGATLIILFYEIGCEHSLIEYNNFALLQVMMEECRLSMLQRKRLQGYINNGESLPVISKHEQKTNRLPSKTLFDVKQVVIGRKRTKLEITNMGAYEKEKVKPKPGGNLL